MNTIQRALEIIAHYTSLTASVLAFGTARVVMLPLVLCLLNPLLIMVVLTFSLVMICAIPIMPFIMIWAPPNCPAAMPVIDGVFSFEWVWGLLAWDWKAICWLVKLMLYSLPFAVPSVLLILLSGALAPDKDEWNKWL